MKISIVLQVLVLFYEYNMISAIYGFGDEPEDPERIRIFLDDDEKLLVPKNSKVEYISPVIDYDEEVILDKPPTLSSYVSKIIRKPAFLPSTLHFGKRFPLSFYNKPPFTFDDPRFKELDQAHSAANFLGGYLGTRGFGDSHDFMLPQSSAPAVISGLHQHPFTHRKLLKPLLIIPNGWNKPLNLAGPSDVKPVTEEQPDDLKYDFRTKMHSIR